MEISVYTDLDSLFDTRRGILHKLALESGNGSFNWDVNFKDIYARRGPRRRFEAREIVNKIKREKPKGSVVYLVPF